MSLRVGFVISHPSHTSLGSLARVKALIEDLSQLEVECHVFTPFSYEIEAKRKIYLHRFYGLSKFSNLMDFAYGAVRKIVNKPWWSRNILLNEKSLNTVVDNLGKQLIKAINETEVDIIQAEQEMAAMISTRMKDKLEKPIIVDLQNIWPEELVAMNIIKRGSSQWEMLQRKEEEILKNADMVTVDYDGIKHYIKSNYDSVSMEKVVSVPLGGKPRVENIETRLPPVKILFNGLVTYRSHVDLFVKSMPIILKKHPNAQFYITKKGDTLNQIKKLAKSLNVRPEFFWFPSEYDLFKFMASCHVGILPSTNDVARKIGLPTKLFDYMSVGLPIVANDVGTWTDIVKDEKVGIVTEDNPESFAEGVCELLADEEMSLRYGCRGLELVKSKFNSVNSAKILLNKYKTLLR